MNKDEGMFKDWGTGRKDTRAPTDFYQAGTEQGDFYQYEDDKDVSTTAKLRKVGKEVITERHLQHKVRTKGTYEAGENKAGGVGRQGAYEAGGAGRHDQGQDGADTNSEGEGAGQQGENEAKGAGRQGTHEVEGGRTPERPPTSTMLGPSR